MWSSTDRLVAFLIWIRHQVVVSVLVFVILSTVISFSISFYSAFYYLYMPSQTYASPRLDFIFDPCDVHIQNEKGYSKCSFPTATVDFRDSINNHEKDEKKQRNYLLPTQHYTMQLSLNLALPYHEKHNRMFLTCLTLLDFNGDPVHLNGVQDRSGERCVSLTIIPKSSYARLVDFFLHYPFQVIRNIFTYSSLSMGLTMATELSQMKEITFHPEYQDTGHHSAVKAVIQIKDVEVEPLDATFHIHVAHISWNDPISYLMTKHSTVSCVVTVLAISIPSLILILVTWDRFTRPTVVKHIKQTDPRKHSLEASETKTCSTIQEYESSTGYNSNPTSRYDHARQRLARSKSKNRSETYDNDQNQQPYHEIKNDDMQTDDKGAGD